MSGEERILPEGWAEALLGEIAEWGSGGTPDRKDESYYNGTVPWIKTGELGNRFVLKAEEFISDKALRNSSAKLFPKGSVAIAMYGATIGKTSILGIDAATNQACAVAQPIASVVETIYLYYLLRSEKDAFIAKGKGGAQPNISQGIIKNHSFPLAPLAEQKVIADTLEGLLAQVDTLQARLDAIPAILKRFRQSVLSAAVTGKLTEEWRGESDTLHWKYKKASEVCGKVQSGGTPKDGFIAVPDIPFLKVYNIVNQRVEFGPRSQYIAASVHKGSMSKSAVIPGDVLMNIVGPPLGKVAVVTDEYPEWNINQAITLFRPSEKISTGWIYAVLCSGVNIQGIVNETKGSAGQVNISLSQCRDFIFPLPPLPEQHEIVRRVEELFAYADQIEKRVEEARSRAKHLTQSILAKAFCGELTAQWRAEHPELVSGENSAQALLERIRAARPNVPEKGKRGRKVVTESVKKETVAAEGTEHRRPF